ncbi:MAG: 4-hydroxy-3-methylbut-2-enyl diphosphate reductase [Dehalococcoidales bacterium]|jgi:4-hydroxy-3-methylbut-2-enyl diphosphate reductase
MTVIIEKAAQVGFCFGVGRALEIVERMARERGGIEMLGAVVHNSRVMEELESLGCRVARGPDDVRGSAVVTSAHGIAPEMLKELKARRIEVIDTTCPFVRRAQTAARKLARDGFLVVVYGEAAHPEVKGILGWAGGRGLATLDTGFLASLHPQPRRLGVVSQTTQVPARFQRFIKKLVSEAFTQNSEFRLVDTICHDIRQRQAQAAELAGRVNLMIVVGGRESANTRYLASLCSRITMTHRVASAGEIKPPWLQGHQRIGIASGASTPEITLAEVMARVKELTAGTG